MTIYIIGSIKEKCSKAIIFFNSLMQFDSCDDDTKLKDFRVEKQFVCLLHIFEFLQLYII